MLNCKYCSQELTFDDNHVSKKTNKKIPLDIISGEPHRCQEGLQAYRSEHPLRCRQCGAEIYFDDKITSSSGKVIPLDFADGNKHDCPNSQYRSKGRFR